jgi:two-component system NarL family sensor kinase
VLIVAGHGIAHPNPSTTAFYIAVAIFSAWAVGALVVVYVRDVTIGLTVLATAVDVAAITALAVLSGGAFSQARLAYLLVPIAVAFRFRPAFTAAAATSTVVAYLVEAFAHPAASRPQAVRFIVVYAGYLAWVGAAAVLLSYILARRTDRVRELAAVRQRLLTDALTAEERERQALAESLHDNAIQNLLSVGHQLEEIGDDVEHVALARAERAIAATIAELREALFELHPYVLERAGLEAVLPAIGRRAARRGGFRLSFDLRYSGRHPDERLLAAAARELLANAAEHSGATEVAVRLARSDGELVLVVVDNGRGFDQAVLADRVGEGHIGLASQRLRVESVGGRLEIHTGAGSGTTAVVRLPSAH